MLVQSSRNGSNIEVKIAKFKNTSEERFKSLNLLVQSSSNGSNIKVKIAKVDLRNGSNQIDIKLA